MKKLNECTNWDFVEEEKKAMQCFNFQHSQSEINDVSFVANHTKRSEISINELKLKMALQVQCPSCFTFANKPYHLLPHLQFTKTTRFTVKSQTPSEPSESTQVPPKKPTSQGLGFGSSASSPTKPDGNSKQKKGRASIIRRSPVEKPVFSEEDEAKAKEMGTNEGAFVLAWLGLGGVILVEGLALAASGMVT